MTGTTIHSAPAPLTAAEMLEQGFSPVQIRDLTELRDGWNPAAEQVETVQDWRRIQFAKWLYDNGHYSEEVEAA